MLAKPPTDADVAHLMHSLFGLKVTAAPVKSGSLPYGTIAEYVDAQGQIAGYIACDLQSACRIAAALTHIPSARVAEAVQDGSIPATLLENLTEIMNISVNLLKAPTGVRLVLKRCLSTDCSEWEETLAAAQALHGTVLGFDIDRYGVCQLAVIC